MYNVYVFSFHYFAYFFLACLLWTNFMQNISSSHNAIFSVYYTGMSACFVQWRSLFEPQLFVCRHCVGNTQLLLLWNKCRDSTSAAVGSSDLSAVYFLPHLHVCVDLAVCVCVCVFSRNQKDVGMGGLMQLPADNYWLAKCMNKNHNINDYILHNNH